MTVLCGSATATGATIITIPAGAVWVGALSVSAVMVASPGDSAKSDRPYISISGAGSEYSDGTILVRVAVATSPSLVLSLLGDSNGDSSRSDNVFIDNSSNGSSINLVLTHASTTVSAVAVGRY